MKQFADSKGPSSQETREGIKIVQTPETDELASELFDLEGAIAGDQKISAGVFKDVVETLDNIPVDFFGGRFTLAQVVPIAKEQAEIMKEIENSNCRRAYQLKYLPVKTAEHLGNIRGGILSMVGLVSISDAAAEQLSRYEGDLALNLTHMSDAAFGHLSRQRAKLSLDMITSISDLGAEHLSKHRRYLRLGLTSISDSAAESLSKYQGNLALNNLRNLSKKAFQALKSHSRLSLPNDLRPND